MWKLKKEKKKKLWYLRIYKYIRKYLKIGHKEIFQKVRVNFEWNFYKFYLF